MDSQHTPIDIGPHALVGQTVAGRYEILEAIGEGGMGTVYRAEQKPIGRIVALKVLLPELVQDALKLQRFVNEARILSQLRHPHTVSLIDFGQLENDQLFIVMDYVRAARFENSWTEDDWHSPPHFASPGKFYNRYRRRTLMV